VVRGTRDRLLTLGCVGGSISSLTAHQFCLLSLKRAANSLHGKEGLRLSAVCKPKPVWAHAGSRSEGPFSLALRCSGTSSVDDLAILGASALRQLARNHLQSLRIWRKISFPLAIMSDFNFSYNSNYTYNNTHLEYRIHYLYHF